MGQPVIALAHQLNSRDLRLIFPLLAGKGTHQVESTNRQAGRFQDKLFLIVRERASSSLYHHGWMVYQQTYPCAPVARALAILCRILDIKQSADSAAPLNRLTRLARSRTIRNSLSWNRPVCRLVLSVCCMPLPASRGKIRRRSRLFN